jgi:hypothetical protein
MPWLSITFKYHACHRYGMDSRTLRSIVVKEKRCQVCYARCSMGTLVIMSLAPYSNNSLYTCVNCFRQLTERFSYIAVKYNIDNLREIPDLVII